MARLVAWERQIGRRLRLRDLFVFFTVVEYGSMAKAAAKLGVSTPSISQVIAALEHALGVRLLDRSPTGVVTTRYGDALLARGRAAFDELRLGIRDIEFLADPHAGELRVGAPESLAAGFLVPVLERFSREHPRVQIHVLPVRQPTLEFPELHERRVDLVMARLANEHPGELTVIALGPLTNVARLLKEHPDAAKKLKRVVVMGVARRSTRGRAAMPARPRSRRSPSPRPRSPRSRARARAPHRHAGALRR